MTLLLVGLALALALSLGALALMRRRLRQQTADAQTGRALERARATEAERRRILDDLHDDIGAKLLTLVHTLEKPEQADLARALMQDLRDVVSRTRTGGGSLLEVLALIRDETEQRLQVLHAALDWQQSDALPDPALDAEQSLNLFRIVREAVTNAIRHGHVQRLRVRARAIGDELAFEIIDDGPGISGDHPGRGTATMQSRAAELHGSVGWQPGTTGGTKVVLRFPLPRSGD